ncbi:MAG: response regulator [Spirochaetales bacterium]|nr:response regulator [Spirochaetales bacterium]
MKNSNNKKGENLKILIAEDDFLVSEMIEGELVNSGYEVLGKASDGNMAFELTQSLKPDIVLMDIRMPELNGLEASRKIMESCPTPIIILTAYETRNMVVDAGAVGVGAYLNKPLDIQELERAILISMARFEDIMNLRDKNIKLEEADKLKVALMKEIHHRVKNNFQLISSLLNLQIGGLENSHARGILESGRDRVQTLAVLHEKLYEIGDFISLPMNVFIEDIIEALLVAYNGVDRGINLEISIDNIVLDSKKAVTIGLILNEVVTNSIKYAFPESVDKKCIISVSMKVDDKDIILRMADNGIGVSDMEKLKSGDTLGLQLIHLLTESQLAGSIKIQSTEGLEILIRFKP